MRFLIKSRGGGKTYKLIIASEVTGYPILAVDGRRKQFIKDMAKEMSTNIPEPINYEQYKQCRDGLNVAKMLIDDAEKIIADVLNSTLKTDVVAVTLTDHFN